MQIYGHRGAGPPQHENTLAAFAHAAARDAHGVELDVRAHGDSLLVIHDDSVDRTTDGHGTLAGLDLYTIRSLDAGAGQQIPLLDEVIALAATHPQLDLNLEIKDRRAAELLAHRLATDARLARRVVVSAFAPCHLALVAGCAPRMALICTDDASDACRQARALGCEALHPHHRQVDRELQLTARSYGLLIRAWTVNAPDERHRLHALGVDAIITDQP
ncbi:MAG: glycerophosphodiester phosphodiesterase [Planctomycetota bacterium]